MGSSSRESPFVGSSLQGLACSWGYLRGGSLFVANCLGTYKPQPYEGLIGCYLVIILAFPSFGPWKPPYFFLLMLIFFSFMIVLIPEPKPFTWLELEHFPAHKDQGPQTDSVQIEVPEAAQE